MAVQQILAVVVNLLSKRKSQTTTCPASRSFGYGCVRERGELSSSRAGSDGQGKRVIRIHQLFDAVLLQHYYIGEVRTAFSCTVFTVHYVCLPTAIFTGHKQQVKHLHIALITVVGRLILHSTLVGDLFPCRH